jgi:predicted double-glycine peptidase
MIKKASIFLIIFQMLIIQSAFSKEVAIIKGNTGIRMSVKSWTEFRDEKVVRQKYDYSCGAASMATILNYFFYENVTEEEIVGYFLQQRGLKKGESLKREDLLLSFKDLEDYANAKGYKVVGLALPMESLKKLKVPAIAYVEIRSYQHFTVYKGMDDTFVYLADPSLGNIMLKVGKFEKIFYTREGLEYPGKAIVLIPQDKEKDTNNSFVKAPEGTEFLHLVIKDKAIQGLLP